VDCIAQPELPAKLNMNFLMLAVVMVLKYMCFQKKLGGCPVKYKENNYWCAEI